MQTFDCDISDDLKNHIEILRTIQEECCKITGIPKEFFGMDVGKIEQESIKKHERYFEKYILKNIDNLIIKQNGNIKNI